MAAKRQPMTIIKVEEDSEFVYITLQIKKEEVNGKSKESKLKQIKDLLKKDK